MVSWRQTCTPPADFEAQLATLEAWFDCGATLFDLYVFTSAVDTDWSGWLALGFGIAVTLLTIFMTSWIYQYGQSPEPNRTLLDMLSLANIAWAVFGIILSFVAMIKVDARLKPYATVAHMLAWVALAFGVSELIADSG